MSTPIMRIRGEDGEMHAVPILGGQVKVGETAGLPVFTGEGGTAVAKAVPEALAALGLAVECGRWQPTFANAGMTGTIELVGGNNAIYYKIGRLVTIAWFIEITVTNLGTEATSSSFRLGGIPFATTRSVQLYQGFAAGATRGVDHDFNAENVLIQGESVYYMKSLTNMRLSNIVLNTKFSANGSATYITD